jgi:hypothetical protein
VTQLTFGQSNAVITCGTVKIPLTHPILVAAVLIILFVVFVLEFMVESDESVLPGSGLASSGEGTSASPSSGDVDVASPVHGHNARAKAGGSFL